MDVNLKQIALSLFAFVPMSALCAGGYISMADFLVLNFLLSVTMTVCILAIWCLDRRGHLSAMVYPYNNALYFGFTAALAGSLLACCLWMPVGVVFSGWLQVAFYAAVLLNIFAFRPFSYRSYNTTVLGGVMILYYFTPMLTTIALALR